MNGDGAAIEPGAAGAPEGAFEQPTNEQVGELYEELGIKAPVPTGKSSRRSKADTVRNKDVSEDDDSNTKPGRKNQKSSNGKQGNAPASAKDGDTGSDTNKAGAKKRSDSGEVSDEPEEADGGVRKTKSAAEKDPERTGEDDANVGDDGAGKKSNEPDSEEENNEASGEGEGGKRPGKSNPEVEKRFQKLTAEIKARDELIEQQTKELQEIQRKQQEFAASQEDPEYTIDDFRKVRDDEGNILDLTPEEAELAWRRWQDGYNQRKAERDAQYNREQAIEEYQRKAAEEMMQSSVAAYDTLVDIYENTPELQADSSEFDEEFSNQVMPIIEDAVIYQPGTEPGNEDNYQPVIVGLRVDPSKIIKAMNAIRQSKRSLPLNGITDTVESGSNVRVTHKRSSDPTVNAANELYQELGIDKRL